MQLGIGFWLRGCGALLGMLGSWVGWSRQSMRGRDARGCSCGGLGSWRVQNSSSCRRIGVKWAGTLLLLLRWRLLHSGFGLHQLRLQLRLCLLLALLLLRLPVPLCWRGMRPLLRLPVLLYWRGMRLLLRLPVPLCWRGMRPLLRLPVPLC